MNISAVDVKNLRDRTGCGIMECKEALKDSGGDLEKGIEESRIIQNRQGNQQNYVAPS